MKTKKLPDLNKLAFSIVDETTGEKHVKNPAAVALGRLGGLKGGRARAKKLSQKKRVAIATRAANARWAKR